MGLSRIEAGTVTTDEQFHDHPRVAIFGADGRIGRTLEATLGFRYDVTAVVRRPTEETGFNPVHDQTNLSLGDITNEAKVDELVAQLAGSGVRTIINCAGETDIGAGEQQRGDRNGSMYQTHVEGARILAAACARYGIQMIQMSTEYVFEGETPLNLRNEERQTPTLTADSRATWYGITKALGELASLEAHPSGVVIIRCPQVQMTGERGGYFTLIRDAVKRFNAGELGQLISLAYDQLSDPLNAQTVAQAVEQIEQLMHRDSQHVEPLYNLGASDTAMIRAIGIRLAMAYGLSGEEAAQMVGAIENPSLSQSGIRRPTNATLASGNYTQSFGEQLPTVDDEIAAFVQQYPV